MLLLLLLDLHQLHDESFGLLLELLVPGGDPLLDLCLSELWLLLGSARVDLLRHLHFREELSNSNY